MVLLVPPDSYELPETREKHLQDHTQVVPYGGGDLHPCEGGNSGTWVMLCKSRSFSYDQGTQ